MKPSIGPHFGTSSWHSTLETPMTAITSPPIHYPTGDGQPVAETFDHLYVILVTIEVLRQYFEGSQTCILGNQFLYYSEGYP
jgi:hypothetical protein